MRIPLFFLATSLHYGGTVAFTKHLHRALSLRGHTPFIVRIAKVGGPRRSATLFGGELPIVQMGVRDAYRLPKGLIVAAWWKDHDWAIEPLLRFGHGLILHEPLEFQDGLLDVMRAPRAPRPVVIRPTNERSLRALGFDPIHIPHVYVPVEHLPVHRDWHAISIARIDPRKCSHLLFEANATLPSERRIRIYGDVSRRYAKFNLEPKFPTWEDQHLGAFPEGPESAVRLAERTRYVVDMTDIKGDGGGTQYTFFEAWNAGATLVLNAAWRHDDGEVVDRKHGFFVDGSAALADFLRDPASPTIGRSADVEALFAAHSVERIIPQYEAYLRALNGGAR